MDQGGGTRDRTERRTQRRPRRGDGEPGGGSDRAAACQERKRADAWFDSWLTPDAEAPTARTATARALALLSGDGWTILHDLPRPGSIHLTVEQIAVGPGGIVLVETLRWDGDVTVAAGTLRHRGHGRTADVAAAAGAAGAVTALLAPCRRRAVRAVLCLAARDFDPVAVCGGAVVVGERQLAAYLMGLPDRLTAADVALMADHLTGALAGPARPELLTVDDVFRPDATDDIDRAEAGGAADAGDTGDASDTRDTADTREAGGAADAGDTGDAPSTRPAPGGTLLHLGVIVLGLLTVGTGLLTWLGTVP